MYSYFMLRTLHYVSILLRVLCCCLPSVNRLYETSHCKYTNCKESLVNLDQCDNVSSRLE